VALDVCAVQAINVTLVVTFKWALIAFKVGLDYFFKWAVIYKSQGPKQRFLVAKIRQNAKKEKGLEKVILEKNGLKKTKFTIF